MSEGNSDSEVIPGITIPLAKIVPTTSIGTFPVKRCSSRKRASPDFYVPTHFRPSPRLHDQGLRRGRGRPPKQSSDAPESPASQPLRRVLGRPRKQRSDGIDVEVPSMKTTQSPASQPLRGPGRPGKQRSNVREMKQGTMVSPEVTEAPASPLGSTGDSPLTSSPEAVAPTPLESTSDRPLEVPTDEEETKLDGKPSRILMHPPKTNYTPQQILDEETKKVILKVESLLVQKLLTSGNDVDYMVHQANTTFRYLKGLRVDYGSFYKDVTEHIKHRCDLQDTEKEETMWSLLSLQKKYENDKRSVNDIEEDLGRTQGEREKAKKKKETLKRQIENLKKEVAAIEHEEEHLKHDEIKYKEAHEVAKAKMQELGTKLEAAQAKQMEIEQRKNAALQGIESTTQCLESTYR